MEEYLVLLKYESGINIKQFIIADSANSARLKGKSFKGVYEAVILNKVDKPAELK